MYLSGDIGGTNTRLALYSYKDNHLVRGVTKKFPSREYKSLEDIAENFLSENKAKVNHACFGVAGPVIDGSVKTTNLPWHMSESSLSERLKIRSVKLINDLGAISAGIRLLDQDQLVTLYPGKPIKQANLYAVVAPGTGLGHGFLLNAENHIHIIPSEGSGISFAPQNQIETDLLIYLSKTHKHVSVEDVISGLGMINIYNFLKDTELSNEPLELASEIANDSPGAVITNHGLNKRYDICVRTLQIFTETLGSHAGNMMLSTMATAGVYLAGGIPPKILPVLKEDGFIKSYLNKGKLTYAVESAPVRVVMNELVGLDGAASIASELDS